MKLVLYQHTRYFIALVFFAERACHWPVQDEFDQQQLSFYSPLYKQSAIDNLAHQIYLIPWKKIGNAENQTWGRWARSKNAIRYPLRQAASPLTVLI